jgi:hypothetical protein
LLAAAKVMQLRGYRVVKKKLMKRFFVRLGRFFWSWGFLKFVLGLIVLVNLFYVEEDWRGARAWAITKARWETKGESFDYSSFIPPPIPDDQNLAAIPLFKLESVKDIEGRSQLYAVNLQKALGSDYPQDDLPSLGSWQKGELPDMDKIKQVIASNFAIVFKNEKPPDSTLAQFDVIYPFVADFIADASTRHSFRYSQNYYALLPPVVRPLGPVTLPIKLSKIITLHAILALHHQQSDLALEDIEANYTLASGLRRDPSLVGGLVAIGILAISHSGLYDGLACHCWNDVQLAEVEHALGRLNLLDDYQFSVRSEAAESVANLEFYRKSASENFVGEWFSLRTQNVPFILWAAPPWPGGWWDQNISKLVVFHFQELATVDPKNRLAFPKISLAIKQQIDEESTKWDGYAPWNIWFVMAASGQTEMMLKFAQAQVWIDEARISCALERYRLAHGVYPGSLDALAPDCIDALPHDVMNGQPYHYQLRPDGTFLLYSVGWNQTDDGGKIADKKDYQKSVDYDEGDWVWQVPTDLCITD